MPASTSSSSATGSHPGSAVLHLAPIEYECTASVELPDCAAEEAHITLLAGRHRHSVGGQIAEGLRWWHGQMELPRDDLEITAGTRIWMELDNGRTAVAVAEPAPDPGVTVLRGVGPPPFEVP